MGDLSKFEGLEVMAVGVEMPNAAGGLQDAMKFQPVEWHQGDEYYIVLHAVVTKIRHEPMVRENVRGPQRRVHVLSVDEAAPIDARYVKEQLAEHREAIEKAKEQAMGVQRLGLEEGGGDKEGKPAAKKTTRKKTTAKKTTAKGEGGNVRKLPVGKKD